MNDFLLFFVDKNCILYSFSALRYYKKAKITMDFSMEHPLFSDISLESHSPSQWK